VPEKNHHRKHKMARAAARPKAVFVIEADHFQQLIDALRARAYQVIGPTVRDNAIVYDEVTSVADLPVGYTDEQEKGTYRLRKREDRALFGYTVGAHSWKKLLYPSILRLWQAVRDGNGFKVVPDQQKTPKLAFLGVRACELNAIAIQDKVFLEGAYVDSTYKLRRDNLFIVAVNCAQAGGTCFCASMNTGPKVSGAYDLALTEILDAESHLLVVEVGTALGLKVMEDVPHREATEADREAAERVVAETAQHMGRSLDTTDLKELLYRNAEHPRWEEVASRCLTCANCTMVCPTCFCATVEDVTDLTGDHAERVRKWDSCFTLDFSYIAGGSVRSSVKARYRQWMTHKLATWVDQFGTFGCVGCGRCITWCPVGIDITEEAQAIREGNTTASRTRELAIEK
jgi:formate hydrogenlyase subunit 6/NADH:ubiquinone oxidoreductase subunit I